MMKRLLPLMLALLLIGSTACAEERTVTPTAQITELESGLSTSTFTGEDGFEDFLLQGGASSDREVVQYLLTMMGEQNPLLQFASNLFGCSTIAAQNAAGETLFGRNFDWYNCNAMVVLSTPTNGYASLSTVNMDFITQGTGLPQGLLPDDLLTLAALYAPLDGMNEAGFAVSVNMIQDRATMDQQTDKPDITTTTAVRLLLNQAGSVDEAVALLEQYDMHASMGWMVHFAMADKSGRSVVAEYINGELHLTETPVVTNFYLTEGEKYGIGTAQSMTRYEVLMNYLNEHEALEMQDLRDALNSVSKHNYQDGETTEWSIVFNLNTGEAQYYHREDFTRRYDFTLRSKP